jgi:hypothetical protein
LERQSPRSNRYEVRQHIRQRRFVARIQTLGDTLSQGGDFLA